MTLRARNRVLSIVNVLLFAAVAAAGVAVFPSLTSIHAIAFAAEPDLYGIFPSVPPFIVYSIVVGSVAGALIGIVGTLLMRRLFRKSISPILFFLALSLVMHGFTVVRLLQIPLYELGFGPSWSLLVSRLAYFFHFAGVFSVFAAGFHAASPTYARLWSVTGLIVTVALVLSYMMPLDAAAPTPALVHRSQPLVDLQLLTGFFSVLSVVNFARYVRNNEDIAGRSVITAATAIAFGRELMFYRADEISQLAGGALLIIGIVLFIRSSYAVYLWA